jgi:hypothetical protein
MSVDPLDRPTFVIDANRPVADQLPPAATPDQAPVTLTPGLLQALGVDLVAKPRPEPVQTSHLVTSPFPVGSGRHYFNSGSGGLHFGENHGRLQIDLTVCDVDQLARFHGEVARRRETLQADFAQRAAELQTGDEAQEVRRVRQRLQDVAAREQDIRSKLALLEEQYRAAVIAGQATGTVEKKIAGLKGDLPGVLAQRNILQPVLQDAIAKFRARAQEAKRAARAELTTEVAGRERDAETRLGDAVTESAMRLEMERAVLRILGNDNAAEFAVFDADVQ